MLKPKIVIVASEQDIASKNIGHKILELGHFKKVERIAPYPTYQEGNNYFVWHDKKLVEEDVTDLDTYFQPELYLFVFRHLGKGLSRLTVHPVGNFTLPKPDSKVPYRGLPHHIAYTNPAYMKEALKFMHHLNQERNLNYSVSYEVTHHTPTELKAPVMFLEIGDTEVNHNDEKAIVAVAETALHLLNTTPPSCTNCIAIGGDHYAERFTRRALNGEYGFGHFIAGYALPDVTPEVLEQAINKTVGGVKFAIIDSKTVGQEQKPLLSLLESKGIDVIKLPK